MREEIQIDATAISWLSVMGFARDRVKFHSEFLLLGLLRFSIDEVVQRAGIEDVTSPADDNDFSEKFIAISGTPAAIEILVTQVKCPLPPTHAAAFISAGYSIVLREANLEAANQWLKDLEPRVQENYREIDQIVDAYFNHNPGMRNEDIQGFDPADSPTRQGLPEAIAELERVKLI